MPRFAFHAAHAEAAGHQYGIEALQAAGAVPFDAFAVDIGDLYVGIGVDAGVFERFGERFVGLGEIDVFADHR